MMFPAHLTTPQVASNRRRAFSAVLAALTCMRGTCGGHVSSFPGGGGGFIDRGVGCFDRGGCIDRGRGGGGVGALTRVGGLQVLRISAARDKNDCQKADAPMGTSASDHWVMDQHWSPVEEVFETKRRAEAAVRPHAMVHVSCNAREVTQMVQR